jgi:hypothetical protein
MPAPPGSTGGERRRSIAPSIMPNPPDPVQRPLALVLVLWTAGVAGWAALPGGAARVWTALLLAGGGAAFLSLLLVSQARRAVRAARVSAVADARALLQARLSDHLHLLVRAATAPDRELDQAGRARLAEVAGAAREVESTLDMLSEASIEAWRARPSAPEGEG